MDIQAEKLELMRLILETDNPSILESIKKLLRRDSNEDFWSCLSQDQKDEIDEGIRQIDAGDVVEYEDLMKKHR